MGYNGLPPPSRDGAPRIDSARSVPLKPDSEEALSRHYNVLRQYLASHLRDEKGNMKPNRARDKLLRLSVTQFMELSTDVFDELIRREDERLQRVTDSPRFLLPKENFHPKRNQARQKLSTLPIERFRQLATDVFYELERRIPRFAVGEAERPMSSASNRSGPMRPMTSGGGMRGPPSAGSARPPMGSNSMAPPAAPYQSFRPASPGQGSLPPGSRLPSGGSDSSSNFNRPLPKTFQSNTIVPNKSTMVEDTDNDEEDEEPDDRFGLSKAISRISEPPGKGVSVAEREKLRTQEAEIAELRENLERLENRLAEKDKELEEVEGRVLDKEQEMAGLHTTLGEKEKEIARVQSLGQTREEGLNQERNQWFDLREELEQKHVDAQRLHGNLQRELEQLQQSRAQDERDLIVQHEKELEAVQSEFEESHGRDLGKLQTQLAEVHSHRDDLHAQLQRHVADSEVMRNQLQEQEKSQRGATNEEYERRIATLEQELETQEKMTSEVQHQAMLHLQEMRDLSRQNDETVGQEERLATQVSSLQRDVETWRQRYAKLKSQNKSLRASTMGLDLHSQPFDAGNLLRKDGVLSDGGLIRDVDMTHFQLAIDALLKSARRPETDALLDSVKDVVVSVQSITAAVGGTDGYPTPSPSPMSSPDEHDHRPQSVGKLKARVTGTANSLITATKLHQSAKGMAPVALLDAAASNLTSSVVALVMAVGVRPSSDHDLNSEPDVEPSNASADDDGSLASFYDDRLTPEPTASSLPMVVTPDAPKPAPLNIGRSGTVKTAGWFGGWGKKSVDETGIPALEGSRSGGEGEAMDKVDVSRPEL